MNGYTDDGNGKMVHKQEQCETQIYVYIYVCVCALLPPVVAQTKNEVCRGKRHPIRQLEGVQTVAVATGMVHGGMVGVVTKWQI